MFQITNNDPLVAKSWQCIGDYTGDGLTKCTRKIAYGQGTRPIVHIRPFNYTLCPHCLYLLPRMIMRGMTAFPHIRPNGVLLELYVTREDYASSSMENLIRITYDAVVSARA